MARTSVRHPGLTSGQSVLRAVLLPASVLSPREDSGGAPSHCRCGEQPAGDPLPPDPAEPSRAQPRCPQLPHGLPARGERAKRGPGGRGRGQGGPNSVPGPGGLSCSRCPRRAGSGVSLARRTSRPDQARSLLLCPPCCPPTWPPSLTDGSFLTEVHRLSAEGGAGSPGQGAEPDAQ